MHNLRYFERQLAKLPPSARLTRAVLLAGAHTQSDGFPRSSAYIRGVRDFFRSRGYSVDLRLGLPADDDVLYVAHARYFLQGGGGFSITLAEVVRAMGGAVLHDQGLGVTKHGFSHGDGGG